jgi:hypothetical protein
LTARAGALRQGDDRPRRLLRAHRL